MREELDTEIATIEDSPKQAVGNEETLIAVALKINWKSETTR